MDTEAHLWPSPLSSLGFLPRPRRRLLAALVGWLAGGPGAPAQGGGGGRTEGVHNPAVYVKHHGTNWYHRRSGRGGRRLGRGGSWLAWGGPWRGAVAKMATPTGVTSWPAIPLVEVSTLPAPSPLYIYGRGLEHRQEEEAEEGGPAEAAASGSSEIGGGLYDVRYAFIQSKSHYWGQLNSP
ncbi:hypothetical protein GB937_000728 [Aspergillus fischeri]|nr:hypothetical protein GB937_000728 [Aspergillus fischeri]